MIIHHDTPTIISFIPDHPEVTLIDIGAFKSCPVLRSVTLPASLTMLAMEAFEGCASLHRVEIPNLVTSIGPRAFKGKRLNGNGLPWVAFKNCWSVERCGTVSHEDMEHIKSYHIGLVMGCFVYCHPSKCGWVTGSKGFQMVEVLVKFQYLSTNFHHGLGKDTLTAACDTCDESVINSAHTLHSSSTHHLTRPGHADFHVGMYQLVKTLR